MYYELIQNVIEAIKKKGEMIHYYKQLVDKIQQVEDKNTIQKDILSDEVKHYKMFTTLFTKYLGSLPTLPEPQAVAPDDEVKALEVALKEELKAIDIYRSIMLATSDTYLRDSFFEAVADETEHSIRLAFIYTRSRLDKLHDIRSIC